MSNRELVLVISTVLLLALAGLCLTGRGIHRKREHCGDCRPLSAESVGADSLSLPGTGCGPAGPVGAAGAPGPAWDVGDAGVIGAAGPAEVIEAAGADEDAGFAGVVGAVEAVGTAGEEPPRFCRDSLAAEPRTAGRREEAVRMLPETE